MNCFHLLIIEKTFLCQVWLLTMVPVAEQVPQLLRDKQFELVSMFGLVLKI